jgi:hypothetical protein
VQAQRSVKLPTGMLGGKKPRRLLTFSLPLTVATLLVLLWSFRADLRLAPRPASAALQGERHAS